MEPDEGVKATGTESLFAPIEYQGVCYRTYVAKTVIMLTQLCPAHGCVYE